MMRTWVLLGAALCFACSDPAEVNPVDAGAVGQGTEGGAMSRTGDGAIRTEGSDLLEAVEIFLE